jgi:periplasmic protein TonB
MTLAMPSERSQTSMRWGICFALVLALHVAGVAKLLEQRDFADARPGTEVVELDIAVGDPQEQLNEQQYVPPKPIEQEVQQQSEPELKEAEVTLPKEEQKPEPVATMRPQELIVERVARAPPKASPEVVRKWQMTVNDRLNQFKRYPPDARARHHQGKGMVEFQLDSDGRVVSSKLLKGSGSAILDKELLDLVSRAQPFPVPPNGTGGQDLIMKVPISWTLK